MTRTAIGIGLGVALLGGTAFAQGSGHAPSPHGTASTEIRGKYVARGDEAVYQGGKWIEISYSRPIKRGRDLWGAGADYGQMLNGGAPVWRAGANVSTRLKTEVPLSIAGKTLAPGEYALFIDLKPNNWTLIVSSVGAAATPSASGPNALWGAYGYTPAKDVVRAPMKIETPIHAFDQLTWAFQDMSDAGGTIAIIWDKVTATVPFKVE
jgi:hypothetical protein